MLNQEISGFYIFDTAEVLKIKKIYERYNQILEDQAYYPITFPSVGLLSNFFKEKFELSLDSQVYRLKSSKSSEETDLFLKPTSEAVAYPLTYGNNNLKMPFKWYQSSPVFRNESKYCRKYSRHKQIAFFHEAHAIFSTEKEAKDEMENMLVQVNKFFISELKLPVTVNKRPEEDKFPGAQESYGFDLELENKTIQVFSIHYLGTNFSKVYRKDLNLVYGVCFGLSERILGALKRVLEFEVQRTVFNPNPILVFYKGEKPKNQDLKRVKLVNIEKLISKNLLKRNNTEEIFLTLEEKFKPIFIGEYKPDQEITYYKFSSYDKTKPFSLKEVLQELSTIENV